MGARLRFGLALAVLTALWAPQAAAGAATTSAGVPVTAVCPRNPAPGTVTCFALRRTDVKPKAAGMQPAVSAAPAGYGPADLDSAYNIPTALSGGTVAIVDAYDDPAAESDLATYRAQYGLPACTTANGCFRKVNQDGDPNKLPPADTGGWATEIALDTDMVSASCPLCHILLVEANSVSNPDIGAAENYAAAAAGVRAVSNSFGGPETQEDPTVSQSYFDHPGVAVVVAAGDEGYGAEFPASSPYVTAVGGTTLRKAANARGWTESVWSTDASEGTGSGCSAYEPKPGWQTDLGCGGRTVADLSADADPATAVAIYDSYGSGGWTELGGTSAAAPLIAGMYALADSPKPSAGYAYVPANASGLNDITGGANLAGCVTYLCEAVTGYDGPTGNGSPNGLIALGGPGSVAPPDQFFVTLPSNAGALAPGTSTTATVATATTSGDPQTVALSVTGAPAGVTAAINPGSVVSGNPATMRISTAAGAPAGTYHLTVTGTGSGGVTRSASYTLVVAACSSTQRVTNPGFESGTTDWSASSKTIIGKHTGSGSPRKGKFSAVLDGYGHTHRDNLRQTDITWPASCHTATISFWLKVNTKETSTTAAHDTLTLHLGSQFVGSWSNLTRTHGWTHISVHVNLHGHVAAPTTTTLRFDGDENSTKKTSFVLDDLSFVATP